MTKAEAIFVLEHIEAHNELAKEAKLMAIEALKQPEIVRCNDCKFFDGDACHHGSGLDGITKISYCSYGKRKE